MGLITQLAVTMGKSEEDVTQFLKLAPRKYRVYRIPKRTRGYRIIAQPTSELKNYQRAFITIIEGVLSEYIHSSSMAYSKNKGIKDNAAHHKKNPYLLRMDLENFFHSITPKTLWDVWNKVLPSNFPDESDRYWLERLLFWCPTKKMDKFILSIGAPSSPMISNFCMSLFDIQATTFCKSKKIKYSRYADDLVFSTKVQNILFTIPQAIEEMISKYSMSVNQSKTYFSSKKHNRHITGITITNENRLSVGRERKRYIKHLVHQFSLGHTKTVNDFNHLRGLLSYVRHIEPTFIETLELKYSKALLERILKVPYDQ